MGRSVHTGRQLVSRISVSLPEASLSALDRMVTETGFESRSHAIHEMLSQKLLEHKGQMGNEVMAGTITVFYDHSTRGLQKQLADLQSTHIDEVISSLHVHLMHNQTMEVILVQGPAQKLQLIADKIITLRGRDHGQVAAGSRADPAPTSPLGADSPRAAPRPSQIAPYKAAAGFCGSL